MVAASIHLELISIFTFNYWKHNLRSRLQYIGVYINLTGGSALIFQCQTSCQRYAGSEKKTDREKNNNVNEQNCKWRKIKKIEKENVF